MILLFAGGRIGERVSGRSYSASVSGLAFGVCDEFGEPAVGSAYPAGYSVRAWDDSRVTTSVRNAGGRVYDPARQAVAGRAAGVAGRLVPCPPRGAYDPMVDTCSGGRLVIAKPFILAKDNCRIGAKILRDNKIIRDH